VPSDPARPILPDGWDALAPLIDRVLDAAPERRAALIAELSAGDTARARTLTALVAECSAGMPLLDRPAAEQFAELAAAPEADAAGARTILVLEAAAVGARRAAEGAVVVARDEVARGGVPAESGVEARRRRGHAAGAPARRAPAS